MELNANKETILNILNEKVTIKNKVYDNTFEVFNLLKNVLKELANDLNEHLTDSDKRLKFEYRDRGTFEAEIKAGHDLLIFSMHSNVFEFNREHVIWNSSYLDSDKTRGYCGIINIYNFLSDSFKYNRYDDEGYLIGRIFINKDMHFFTEGKRQNTYMMNSFGENVIDEKCLTDVVETAVTYSIDFELLTPPYDAIKIVSVAQMNTKIESSKIQTGKRLGFKFNSDDVLNQG